MPTTIQAITLLLMLAAVVCLVQSRRETRTHRNMIISAITAHSQPVFERLHIISGRLDAIVEGQRLSTILRLEPASLKVSPEQFEANKLQLRARILRAVEEVTHPDPGTQAYCVLERSGWSQFVEGSTRLAAQTALARLIVNNDKSGQRAFCEELVDKL